MQDTQRRLNSLATALQALAPGDPERTAIIQEMMEISGTSPATFNGGGSAPAPAQPAQPAAQPSATPTPARPTRVTQALPVGQQ